MKIERWVYEDQSESHLFGSEAYLMMCPGCGSAHVFTVSFNSEAERAAYDKRNRGQGPVWQFNGNVNEPTFYPSMMTWWPSQKPGANEVCHFFVSNGFISFCSDSTHHLSGKTVAMKEIK